MTTTGSLRETGSEPPISPSRASTLWITGIAASVAVFLALATASQTYISMWNHGHSFVRILLWQLGCWSFWAIVAPLVVRLSSRQPLWRLAGIGAILTLGQGLVAAQLAMWLQPYIPYVSYDFGEALGNLWWFMVFVDPVVYALLVGGGRAVAAYEQGKWLQLRRSELEGQLARAQLDALRLEIQPHFLFNTLNSIAALIRVNDNPAALSMLLGLSELMRATLDEPKGPLSPLGRELSLIRRYIDLQRARFGDRLRVTYAIDAAAEPLTVPTLLLQPLVENALRHGLAPVARPCQVTIAAAVGRDRRLRLSVSDDGAGLPAGFDLARHAGTGLRNTVARLARLYGEAASLAVRPNPGGGTLITISLPASAAEPAGEIIESGAA